MTAHCFKRDDGMVCVYPPFLANADGYSIIVWNDTDDRSLIRLERFARERAESCWQETHGDAERFERRCVDRDPKFLRDDAQALIEVRFSTKPLKSRFGPPPIDVHGER
jgi:hypothetical protein